MVSPNSDQLENSQKPSEASQYLPRGQKYQQSLADSAKNPRQGVPVSEWISTWNADNAREEAQPTATVKAPDELQKELTMLEHMSKMKQETDDRRPDGGKQKTCAKDNK